MNGLEVLTFCKRYPVDMKKLTQSYAIAMDAATRITPRMDGNGGIRSSDVRSAPEQFAVRAESLSQRMEARRSMYALELQEATALLELIHPETASVLYSNMICGKTIKEIAVEMDASIDSIRARLARGRTALSTLDSSLDHDPEYQEKAAQYQRK